MLIGKLQANKNCLICNALRFDVNSRANNKPLLVLLIPSAILAKIMAHDRVHLAPYFSSKIAHLLAF